MPYIVSGDTTLSKVDSDIYKADYGYKYPEGLDLKPGSKLHTKIKDQLMSRARDSRNETSKRFPSWRKIDQVLTTYIPLKDKEKQIKEKDSTKPVSIIFPYTYSMLEALLTYLSLAFFQDPMLQYEGTGPEDVQGAMLLELVIRLHCYKSKVPLAVHTALRDSLSYGIGLSTPAWTVTHGRRPVKSSIITQSDMGQSSEQQIEWIDDVIFEGNRLDSIDPYMWFPDPSVSSDKVQDGEFVGWMVRDNYMNTLSDEQSFPQEMFNTKYLKHVKDRRSTFSVDESDRELKFKKTSPPVVSSLSPVDKLYMYVNLIPKDWELGPSEYPEKWMFCLASDEIILQAQKSNLAHGMYPVSVASPEFDGYSPTPIGRIEILSGLQETLDWLFNSHTANVRKAINDMFVVDPYLVNIEDIKDPKPGKLIRLRRPAWGKGVDKVVQQFPVTDITRQNIADSAYITQWMDRISGADQSMSGAQRQGGPERLTKGEFQGTRGSAISRLQRLAMIIGMQYIQDIGTMFAVHTQQFMSQEVYVKAIGRNAESLISTFGQKDRIPVSIYDLAINYDTIVRDGSIPGGNFSDAWLQLFQTIGTSPELNQQFDITRIFMYIAQQLGAKNVEDFKRNVNRINPTVMPDEQVEREVQAGNMIPTNEAF
jgi:hypothetical protein